MNRLLQISLLSLISAPVFAAPAIPSGSFDLYSEANHVPSSCNLGTGLILDRGKFLGEVAVFENFVKGTCKIAVRPNTRFTRIEYSSSNCGSKTYQGGFATAEGYVAATITDHRNRRCKDLVPAKIVVSLTDANGLVSYLYSQNTQTMSQIGE